MTGNLINQILEEIGLESLGSIRPSSESRKEQFVYHLKEAPHFSIWRQDQKFLTKYHRNIWE